jgi:hypothetical protein
VLGYDDSEIDTEMRALNQRIDIVLKSGERVFMVIECKNVRSSGQVWKLYRVIPVKGSDPLVIEVFDLALLDEDGVSDEDAEKLYLLTRRAVFGGDTERMYHQIACLSPQRVLAAMTCTRVIKAIRRSLMDSYRAETTKVIRLTEPVVVDRVRDLFFPSEL